MHVSIVIKFIATRGAYNLPLLSRCTEPRDFFRDRR